MVEFLASKWCDTWQPKCRMNRVNFCYDAGISLYIPKDPHAKSARLKHNMVTSVCICSMLSSTCLLEILRVKWKPRNLTLLNGQTKSVKQKASEGQEWFCHPNALKIFPLCHLVKWKLRVVGKALGNQGWICVSASGSQWESRWQMYTCQAIESHSSRSITSILIAFAWLH